MAPDPYAVLGLSAGASDAELRSAYRRLAQRHHPDHNQGSPDAARRFAEIQSAYAQILELRRSAASDAASGPAGPTGDLEARIAELEAELRLARENARRAAAGAGPAPRPRRASPEELGYVTTDDSLTQILDDAAAEFGSRFARSPLGRRLSELLSGEDELN